MDSYKQALPAIGLSIERLTADVPKDGFFYVLLRDEMKGRYRTLKQAQAVYKSLIDESGWQPPATHKIPTDPAAETVERYMDELADYWGSAHRFRRPGRMMNRR